MHCIDFNQAYTDLACIFVPLIAIFFSSFRKGFYIARKCKEAQENATAPSIPPSYTRPTGLYLACYGVLYRKKITRKIRGHIHWLHYGFFFGLVVFPGCLVLIMKWQFSFFLRRIFYVVVLLGIAITAHADAWKQQVVPMVGVTNYAREACLKFKAGDKVQYRFESKHEVNFDIHYHPENETKFKERKDAVKQLAGEFTSEASQHYCFTWKNKHELDTEWSITLHYLAVPK